MTPRLAMAVPASTDPTTILAAFDADRLVDADPHAGDVSLTSRIALAGRGAGRRTTHMVADAVARGRMTPGRITHGIGAVSHPSATQRVATKTVVAPHVGILPAGMKALEVTEDRLSDALGAKPRDWRDLSPTAISHLQASESPQVVFDRGESLLAASR